MQTLGSSDSIFITGASIAVHDNRRRERASRQGAHGGGEELADEEVSDVGVGEGHERCSVVQVAGSQLTTDPGLRAPCCQWHVLDAHCVSRKVCQRARDMRILGVHVYSTPPHMQQHHASRAGHGWMVGVAVIHGPLL